jgi:hypothetical protein
MNVNDLESRMWDCYFSGKAKKLLYPKKQRARTRGQNYSWFGRVFGR